MNQLIIRNKCHWIQNSSVTVKKGAITLASPINIYNKVVFIYMFPHVNSLVLFPPLLNNAVTDEHTTWDSNNCTEHVYLNNCPIAPSNIYAECVWVFLHVYGSTYSNKCSCVCYSVRGSESTHTCLCIYPGPHTS